jgi:hypothetical protein
MSVSPTAPIWSSQLAVYLDTIDAAVGLRSSRRASGLVLPPSAPNGGYQVRSATGDPVFAVGPERVVRFR